MADDFEFRINPRALEALVGLGTFPEMERALNVLGQIAETSAKDHAPVDTGTLRRSIVHEVGEDDIGIYMRYGTPLEYGIYQELGTRYHPAHPFLRPALEAVSRALRR